MCTAPRSASPLPLILWEQVKEEREREQEQKQGAETCAENEKRRISGQGLLEPEHEPEQVPSLALPSSGGLPCKFSLSTADAFVYVQDDLHLEVQLSLD